MNWAEWYPHKFVAHETTEESITSMDLKTIKINTMMAMLSIATSIGVSLVFVFNIGAFKADVIAEQRALRVDVDLIKRDGSVRLQNHVAEDVQENLAQKETFKSLREAMDRRFEAVEKQQEVDGRKIEAINVFQVTVATLNGKLETMDAKLDGVKSTLESHTKATMEMFRGGNGAMK